MVAHTGNIKATIKAIEVVDSCLGEIVTAGSSADGIVIITADHGNAEEMLTFPTKSFFYTSSEGKLNTEHSNNPVPFIIISEKYKGKPLNIPKGALADIAPTVLTLMNLPIPPQMQGKALFPLPNNGSGEEKKHNGVLNNNGSGSNNKS